MTCTNGGESYFEEGKAMKPKGVEPLVVLGEIALNWNRVSALP